MNNKEKKEEKFHLSLVVAGHVDAGKKKIEEEQLFANSISWFTNSCLHYFIYHRQINNGGSPYF